MSDASATGGLQVDPALRDFVADELLAGLDLEPTWFWSTLAELDGRFSGQVAQLLARRDELQQQIDDWHREHGAGDVEALEAFLTEIGYLLPLEEPTVAVTRVDREIAEVPGPQLVVPATVPRYALNAANAGCLLQIRRYWPGDLPMFHPVELLDASIRGADPIAGANGLRDQPRLDARTAEPGTF